RHTRSKRDWSSDVCSSDLLKPSGKYVMENLYEVGGVEAVMKLLLDNGYLHGDCLTVTGKTVAENLETVEPLTKDQVVITPLDERSEERRVGKGVRRRGSRT